MSKVPKYSHPPQDENPIWRRSSSLRSSLDLSWSACHLTKCWLANHVDENWRENIDLSHNHINCFEGIIQSFDKFSWTKLRCQTKWGSRTFSTLLQPNDAQVTSMRHRIRRKLSLLRLLTKAHPNRMQSDVHWWISLQNKESAWKLIEKKPRRDYLQINALNSSEPLGGKLWQQSLAKNTLWRYLKLILWNFKPINK